MAFLPDPKRDAAAERLAESAHLWPVVTLRQQWGAFPAGSRFYSVPSRSNPGTAWLANDRACQCPDYQQRGAICAHVRAVVLHQERQRQSQSQGGSADSADPTPTTAAAADPDGSRAYLASLQDQQAEHARALRAAGTDPADDATWRQRAEHIARLESRHATQARAAAARVPTARRSYADVFGADD